VNYADPGGLLSGYDDLMDHPNSQGYATLADAIRGPLMTLLSGQPGGKAATRQIP